MKAIVIGFGIWALIFVPTIYIAVQLESHDLRILVSVIGGFIAGAVGTLVYYAQQE